jgi:hypothetical protein
MKLYMFRTVSLSIMRSFSPYTQQICMTYTIAVCTVKKTPDDDRQRNCPKHGEFHSKNKFEKLVHLIGFIIREICCVLSCFSFRPFEARVQVAKSHWSGRTLYHGPPAEPLAKFILTH